MEKVIKMSNITKSFGQLVANNNIDFDLVKGEVHAIVGENGAGKSTLMSILFGLITPDSGEIIINGKKANITNPNVANKLKIGMVHQHFKLVDDFTVLQNIVLGSEKKKSGFIDYKESHDEIKKLSNKYKLSIDLEAKISDISVGMQQRTEILKMLYRDADILIFDEPTAVLTPQEIKELIIIIRNFAREGKSVIIITHKLDEVKAVADRCTILRLGKKISTLDVKKTTTKKMAELMVGRDVKTSLNKNISKGKKVLFKANNIVVEKDKTKNYVDDVSFELKSGEILTIAGIEGNGQTQLIRAITGLLKIDSGSIYFNQKDITNYTIREKIEIGIAHIPEDRQKEGLILDFNLKNNIIMTEYYISKFQQKYFLKFNKIDHYTQELIKDFDIRSNLGKETIVRSMSGGNQQKAIIARELSRKSKMLIAVQPTRGLDVGAIEYVHKKLLEARDRGYAILLVSLELDEVFNISDRVLVMYNGKLVLETRPDKINREEIGLYMAGVKKRVEND
jgi:simple sugar transport system ATP-binding protein